jgi:glyoxylase-like metal-dependent hydrolase (beta-lactamase superfamily II)
VIPLSFPVPAPLAKGEPVDIVPGQIKWLRMPLPIALDHINLYLVRDGAGWRLIDTGMDTAATRQLWEALLPALDGPLTGIVCTHHHGDHCGLAGWLTERLRVPLHMSRAEYFAMRLFNESFSFDSWEYREFFTRVGLSREHMEGIIASIRMFQGNSPVARAYQRLRDGETLTIGEHAWEVRGGEGHSPEHASLYCRDLGVLLSGDQLLARISPNVGVMPFEPQANPLAEWFQSLERIGRLPEETLVLPAHELPFYGLATRAGELAAHHRATLDRLHAFCEATPGSVHELSGRLFPGRRGTMDEILAISETLAHLAYLLAQGRVARHLDADGSHRYAAAGSGA